MCVRSGAVESCPVLCESVTFLTRFSAYFRSSYKNIGCHVLIDFAVCQIFSVDNSVQKVKSLDPKPARYHHSGKKGN